MWSLFFLQFKYSFSDPRQRTYRLGSSCAFSWFRKSFPSLFPKSLCVGSALAFCTGTKLTARTLSIKTRTIEIIEGIKVGRSDHPSVDPSVGRSVGRLFTPCCLWSDTTSSRSVQPGPDLRAVDRRTEAHGAATAGPVRETTSALNGGIGQRRWMFSGKPSWWGNNHPQR